MILLFLAGLLTAAVLYQKFGERRDAHHFPAPGRLLSIDGRRLHFFEKGSGAPAVVLESGIAASSLSWSHVQPLLATFTQVVSYDRPGLAWSDPPSASPTLERMTKTLASLLETVQIPPPYLLVGHSFGGLLVRAFAHERPDEVAGLVLVDPVSVETWARCSDLNKKRLARGVKLSRRGAWLARLGIVRLALAAATRRNRPLTNIIAKAGAGRAMPFLARLVGEIQKLPPDVLPAVRAHWSRPKAFQAMAAYLNVLPQCAEIASKMILSPEIPVIVLSAANATASELQERDLWVRQSKRGRHVQIENTGHWLHLERADVVAEAVKELMNGDAGILSNRPATPARGLGDF
jgi:pimeloyl-ACP methyl ester carboxylesterase